ncbi:leucine carboxyl methyltransferase [Hesseltinella vesiculosa]|uniref:Leucine carboxyl methyltransferase 1 n=1 Tax=Hesseltinella vesiculosa TaxID=101127 RepID=A0A1X2GBL3_9FUNG|nr:leucine carboxyl methyltransferase [Hesseltinella vesiculosa]
MSLHSDPSYEAVLQTNDDATVSRQSAVQLGYLQDPFVHFFVKRPTRRMPIINRGSYLRSMALDRMVKKFLAMPLPDKQIVSLGAGFDTRYFMIKSGQMALGPGHGFRHYFEVDLPENALKKARILKQRKELQTLLGEGVTLAAGGAELSSNDYHLIGTDLRDWPRTVQRLQHYGLDVTAPTLFLSECVFIYLPPEITTGILQWITTSMTHVAFALYEQILPNDSFGRMMIRNLLARHIDLKGIQAYPQLEDQEQRFLKLGWTGAKAVDMNAVHDQWLDENDKQRINRLEILDELEEWKLISSHYCVAYAYKSVEEGFAALSVQEL